MMPAELLPFEERACAYFSSAWHGGRSVLLMKAFLDESGTDRGAPVTVVAGCIASVEKWGRFTERMAAINGAKGIPSFHMSECTGGGGAYKSWTLKDRMDCVKECIGVLHDTVEHFVAACVINKDWNALAPIEQAAMQSQYKTCAQWIVGRSTRWVMRKRKKHQLAIVCEEGAGWEQEVRDGYAAAKRRISGISNTLTSFSFADKRNNPELQAADIFAWEMRKAVLAIEGIEKRGIRQSIQALLKGRRCDMRVWNAETLREHLNEFKEHLRATVNKFEIPDKFKEFLLTPNQSSEPPR